ncbi:MAG TPA: exodeoxyribonuclease VII large subunit [Acidimicrobiales bacterium]|nr:exodeoxyribonuclease VII large subunit [Acidimicrobiales bacterium]
MERLRLFDEAQGPQGEARRLSLVRLSSEIARSVGGMGRVAVEGEVVMPRQHPGGTYFTLRDRTVQVSVRSPAARAARCRAVAGERVLVTGVVAWLAERGQLQLVAEEVAPVGEGAIAAAVADRRRRLEAEGLLDRPRRALPRLPATIGVVCGTEAAVRGDIESVVAVRFPGYPMAYVPTNVSGAGAADAMIAALAILDGRPEVEIIVLARGGGDAAQLLPFSDEALCRAICACTTPVVSAVGHEGDRPLCDEVADLRCGTPSLAAAAVVPARAELEAELEVLQARARQALEQRAEAAGTRLARVDRDRALEAGVARAERRLIEARSRLHLVHPARTVAAAGGRLARIDWRHSVARRARHEGERLAGARRHLDALSPARVLERGYAVVRSADGSVVRAAGQVGPGDHVQVQLARGRLDAVVHEAHPSR